MLWEMKGFHLAFILVLCGDAYGFVVWKKTSVIDWQAGLSKTVQNQDSSTFELASDVQTNQHDSHFVQASGDERVRDAYSQAGRIVQGQNHDLSPSNLYLDESSYQPGSTIRLLAGQSTLIHDNSLGVSATYRGQISGSNVVLGQNVTTSHSKLTTNQVSGSQTSDQTDTTTQDAASQSVSAQGNYRAEASESAKWFRILPGQRVPSFNDVFGFHPALYQPSVTTKTLPGQSALTLDQALVVPTVYYPQNSGSNVLLEHNIQSSQSRIMTDKVSTSWTQSRTAAPTSAGQSAYTSQTWSNYGGEVLGHTKWYYILLGQTIPSHSQAGFGTNQTSESQSQLIYQPHATGQFAITRDQASPSFSQSGATTNKMSGSHAQSPYQLTATKAVSASQSVYTSWTEGNYGPHSSGPANWYTLSHGQTIPSYQSGDAKN